MSITKYLHFVLAVLLSVTAILTVLKFLDTKDIYYGILSLICLQCLNMSLRMEVNKNNGSTQLEQITRNEFPKEGS